MEQLSKKVAGAGDAGTRCPDKCETEHNSLFRAVTMMPMVFGVVSVPALATDSPTGLAAVAAQGTTVTTWVGNVFTMLTGNEYFALLMAFGLTGVAIRLYRKFRRSAR